jgi:hypothetical protein
MRIVNEYRIVWDGRNDFGKSAASGIFFYQLVSGHERIIRKMMMVK